MRRSYEDYHVLEEVGFVEILENIGVALERACDVLEKLLALEVAQAEAAVLRQADADVTQHSKVSEAAAERVPAFKIGADLSPGVDEDVIGRIFGIV